ncbi:MAG: DUF1573 domain-containing protein [Crocinitomicaceae bacterium]|nr:DUF1573 domain-containing protein [Crocinitomicaceae bacterium]
MKKILIAVIGLALVGCSSKSEKLEMGNKTTLTVKQEFNAGKVLLGEEIEASFLVKNTGKYPLIIAEVKGSCSCTVADYPEEPIEPGESEEITATVRTDNAAVGALTKEVRVTANTEPSLTILQIKANVTRK